jgi:hypothetical protein
MEYRDKEGRFAKIEKADEGEQSMINWKKLKEKHGDNSKARLLELEALERMTGEEISDHMTDEEREEYFKVLEKGE